MIAGKTVLAIIPARGGSKGVPRKNIRLMAGKPLIAWTIEAAQQSKYIDRLILSSEDEEIIQAARNYYCEVPFIRPVELAQDDTSGVEPLIHAIFTLEEEYNYILVLQPTSPLRTVVDIDDCIEKCIASGAPSCVSVCEAEQSPYWMFVQDEQQRLKKLIEVDKDFNRRQDLPKAYRLNGALYIALCDYFLNRRSFLGDETIGYLMPVSRSFDIDTEIDFEYCEWLIEGRLNRKGRLL